MPFVTSSIGLINLALLILANVLLSIGVWRLQRVYPLLREFRRLRDQAAAQMEPVPDDEHDDGK